MTTEVTPTFLTMVLDHYRNAIAKKFPFRFPTPAGRLEMERYLAAYQDYIRRRERHPAWALPLKLLFSHNGNVDVELDPQADYKVV